MPAPRPAYLDSSGNRLGDRQVLVVLGKSPHRQPILEALGAWQVKIETAPDLETALELISIRDTPFDAVIADVLASEIAAELRAQICNESALITLTSIVDQPAPASEREFFLTKPVSPERLYKLLTRSLTVSSPEDQPTSSPVAKAPADAPLEIGSSLRVLLAEDNPINQVVAEASLDQLGIEVDIAVNGSEVIAAMRRQPYDLILMDIQMPEVDGLEATRRIRADASVSQPYIIAITANATVQDRDQCLAAGMDDYIRKPFRLEDLRLSLRRFFAEPLAN